MSGPVSPVGQLSFQRPMGRSAGRLRGGLREALVLSLVAAATTWVALLSWKGFAVAYGQFMGPLVTVAIVVAVSGAALRWSRVPAPLVVLAQVVVVGIVVSLQLTGAPLPLGDAWDRLHQAFADANASAQQYAAPVPRGAPPIDPLLIAGGAACLLVVDVVVGTLRRVPLAGLPLLTIYSIPVSLLGGGVSWIVFTLTAAGFLVLLYLQESRQIARWGRPLGQDPGSVDPSGFGVSNGALRSSAGAIGGVATALAIVVPIFVPTFGLHLFDGGFGPGGGDKVQIINPMTNMTRDLHRGQDLPMLTVHTQDPDPSYLRIAVLNRFTGNEWSSGNRDAPPDQRAVGQLPPITGLLGSVPKKTYDYQVTATNDFDSTWLPTEYPISRIDAPGDWRYDVNTMDFMAFDKSLTTRRISYSMTAVKPDLSAVQLADAVSAPQLSGSELTTVPDNLPSVVSDYALQVTADQPTKFQKAVALQNWFRDNFTYSLDTVTGNGNDTLESFLTPGKNGRTGYCEQFASAMAVMARTLNIPARVAIGFLRPDQVAADTWQFSSHDLHAWPELYFQGAGWVRFEPTPAARATSVPAYTTYKFPDQTTSLPSVTATSGDVANRSSIGSDPRQRDQQGGSSSGYGLGIPWRWLAAGAGVLVLLVLAGLTPRLVRKRRRERRLAEGPEPVWIEVRDTVVDLGLTWPPGRSPRETGSHLVHYFGPPVGSDPADRPRHGADVSPEAERALERIVLSIEQGRYARPGTQHAAILKADAETVIASLQGGVGPGARRRAEWLPRSLWTSLRRPGSVQIVDPEPTRYGGVVDHVGS